MDGQHFDVMTKRLVVAPTRRGMLRGIFATGLVAVSRFLHGGSIAAAPECQEHIDCRGNRYCERTGPTGRCRACKNESTVCKYGLGEVDCCDNATEVCDGGSAGTGCQAAACVRSGLPCEGPGTQGNCCAGNFCSCISGSQVCVTNGSLGTGACCTTDSQCLQTCNNIDPETGQGVCCAREPGTTQCVSS